MYICDYSRIPILNNDLFVRKNVTELSVIKPSLHNLAFIYRPKYLSKIGERTFLLTWSSYDRNTTRKEWFKLTDLLGKVRISSFQYVLHYKICLEF